MSLKDKINEKRYINRCKKSGMSVIIGKKNNKADNIEKCIADEEVIPCYKTNDEVLEFLKAKYGLVEEVASEYDMIDFKVNYILNERPDILETPEIKFPKGVETTSEQFEAYKTNYMKRLDEARKFPFDKLGLEINTYAFHKEIIKGFCVKFRVISEKNLDELQIRVSINDRKVSKKENIEIRKIIDEITVYKGVKQEDIDNKTKRLMIYLAAKRNLEEYSKNKNG